MKRILIYVGSFLALLGAVVGLMSIPKSSKDFDIVYDQEKIKAKAAFLSEKTTDSSQKRPNIIILFADDLGKTDLATYGNTIVETPNIDTLAAEGAKFSEGYVTAPICSPSRAGLLTGRYQQRFGHEVQPVGRYLNSTFEKLLVNNFFDLQELEFEDYAKVPDKESIAKQGLPLQEITLADLLMKNGYATGIIGKWHQGFSPEFLPLQRGFDYHYGFYEAFSWFADTANPDIINVRHPGFMDSFIWKNGNKGNAHKKRNNEDIEVNEFYTYALANEASQYIEKNKDRPFFLYVPFNAPHTPFQAFDYEVKKYQDKGVTDLNKAVYYAMITGLDNAVGQIHNKVKSLGLEENTLIFFLSDNGGATYTHATDNAPLKGGKMSLYEGGINVPFLAKWKGVIPSKTESNQLVTSLDIFATAAAVSGATLPNDRVYDGVNLVPHLVGADSGKTHEILYWRSGVNKAIRKGDWKLVINLKDNIIALYNLKVDKSETTNLASKIPLKVDELKMDLAAWEKGLVKPLWPSSGYFRNTIDGKVDRFTL
ncbi:MAG: sulfatase-like hydrolase/transferase [Cytophagales bacterium]|nr:sulfatase-like hydrolase/transferase [Cytophagales bacterium]